MADAPSNNSITELQLVEDYISKNSEAEFTHGFCPECLEEHYPDENLAWAPACEGFRLFCAWSLAAICF